MILEVEAPEALFEGAQTHSFPGSCNLRDERSYLFETLPLIREYGADLRVATVTCCLQHEEGGKYRLGIEQH